MFHVGQKVVCVRDDWGDRPPFVPHVPKKGGLYTVRRSYPGYGTTYLLLTEIINPVEPIFIQEPAFIADYFRPITERKTDIEIFRRLLVPGSKIVEPV